MKLIALDASGLPASVAVLSEEQVIAEFTVQDKLTHSQTLLPMLSHIKELLELDLSQIDYIACAAGPGSFTGLRIGASTAKGLALGLKVPVVPVPTLEALAYNVFGTPHIVCPIMDARRNQVYTAFYRWEGETLVPLCPDRAVAMEQVIDEALAFHQPVIFLGDGVPVHAEALRAHREFLLAPVSASRQRAACVGAAALVRIARGQVVPGEEFVPEYLRKSQAEREREAGQCKIYESNP